MMGWRRTSQTKSGTSMRWTKVRGICCNASFNAVLAFPTYSDEVKIRLFQSLIGKQMYAQAQLLQASNNILGEIRKVKN